MRWLVVASCVSLAGCGKAKEAASITSEKPKAVAAQKQAVASKVAAPASQKVATPEAKVSAVVSPAQQPNLPAKRPEKVLYGFENGTQYWEIPDWAKEKTDHVAKSVEASKDYASEGASSLKVMADFPGKIWSAALIEYEEYLDWTPYKAVSYDILVPKEAPEGLKAKIILTVGEDWRFTEMTRVAFLIPGKWTTVSASLEPGTTDWKMTAVDDNFRKDVRKIAVRTESNKSPVYSGPIYIDNFRLTE